MMSHKLSRKLGAHVNMDPFAAWGELLCFICLDYPQTSLRHSHATICGVTLGASCQYLHFAVQLKQNIAHISGPETRSS